MDAKLAEYRAKRRRQELIDTTKTKVKNFFAAGVKAKEEPEENMYPEEREVSKIVMATQYSKLLRRVIFKFLI